MKIAALTHRRSRSRKSPTVSLFPFLAVLICTMGALVPLLLAIARQARLQAVHEATAKAAHYQVDAQTERELAEWRIEELKNSRKQAEEQLSRSRLALGHVENHARRLHEQSAQLRTTLEGLQTSGKQSSRQRAELEGELDQVQTQLSQAEQQLAATQQDATRRPRSYAVIPYEGPHGTYRQPIYIECRSDAIVIQPEGVCLTVSDFDGPLEACNPLDRALRAARELLLAQKKIQGNGSDEPYPLLLVRPDGIPAYYVAREAMKSWRSEIGYELVGKDWDLEFPKADPEVGRVMRGAIAEAREERRRRALLVAMVSDNRSRGAYAGLPGGMVGIGRMGGQGGAGTAGIAGATGTLGGSPGGAPGGAPGTGMMPALPGGTSASGSSNLSAGGGMGSAGGSSSASFLPAGDAGSAGFAGLTAGGGGATSSGRSTGGNGQPGTASQADRLGSDGKLANAAFGDVKPARRGSQVVYRAAPGGGLIREVEPADSSTSSSEYRKAGNSSGVRGGTSAAKKGTEEPPGPFDRPAPAPAGEPSDGHGPDGQAVARRAMLRPGEWIPEEPKPPKRDEEKDQRDGKFHDREMKAKPLADSRGENWGLPNAARGSVGITRPIRVRCSSNRLEIVPDSENVASQAVALGARTEDAIDDFVSAVWEHMKTWGIAGRGMYWRPSLRIEVTPDAEFRYAELKTLLDNSGLIVERKNG